MLCYYLGSLILGFYILLLISFDILQYNDFNDLKRVFRELWNLTKSTSETKFVSAREKNALLYAIKQSNRSAPDELIRTISSFAMNEQIQKEWGYLELMCFNGLQRYETIMLNHTILSNVINTTNFQLPNNVVPHSDKRFFVWNFYSKLYDINTIHKTYLSLKNISSPLIFDLEMKKYGDMQFTENDYIDIGLIVFSKNKSTVYSKAWDLTNYHDLFHDNDLIRTQLIIDKWDTIRNNDRRKVICRVNSKIKRGNKPWSYSRVIMTQFPLNANITNINNVSGYNCSFQLVVQMGLTNIPPTPITFTLH